MGQHEESLKKAYQDARDLGCARSSALDVQVGGSHYKDMKIQPAQFILANNIGWGEGCAIGYLSRWRQKGGIDDLRKAKHSIDLVIEEELARNGQNYNAQD
jgi:hypothetical protein